MRMGPPIPLSTGRGTAGSPSRPSRPFCSDPHVYTRPSSLTHARWSSPQETCVTTTPCNSRSSRGTRSLSDAPSRKAGEGGSGHRVMGQGSSVQRSPRLVCVFEWLDWVVCVPVSHTAPSCYNWSSIWFVQVLSVSMNSVWAQDCGTSVSSSLFPLLTRTLPHLPMDVAAPRVQFTGAEYLGGKEKRRTKID